MCLSQGGGGNQSFWKHIRCPKARHYSGDPIASLGVMSGVEEAKALGSNSCSVLS